MNSLFGLYVQLYPKEVKQVLRSGKSLCRSEESAPAQLRWKSQLCPDVHARRVGGQLRRRHAALALMEDSPESLEIEEVCRGRRVRVEQCVLVYYCQSLVREIDLADQRYTAVDRWSHPQTVKDVVATQCKRGRGTRQLKPGSHYAPLLRIVGWKSRYRVV